MQLSLPLSLSMKNGRVALDSVMKMIESMPPGNCNSNSTTVLRTYSIMSLMSQNSGQDMTPQFWRTVTTMMETWLVFGMTT